MTWVKAQAKEGTQVGRRVARVQGDNGISWKSNKTDTDGKFVKFLDVSCFFAKGVSVSKFFFSQTRGLSASLLFAALGPMSKEQLEVL